MHSVAGKAIARAAVFGCALALAAAPSVFAQPPSPPRDDDAYVVFGRRDGIPDAPILSLQQTTGGRLLLATADGVRLFDGRRWVTVEAPPSLPRDEFRVVLDRGNGDRIFVNSYGVVAQRGERFLPAATIDRADVPIYSAVVAPRRGGGDDIVVGASGGVFQIDTTGGLERVPLPEGMASLDAMVAARLDGAASELWVGTRGGGVARRRDGEWVRWDTTNGLRSLAIEHVALAPIGDTLTALVATSSGAFALRNNRWAPIGPRTSVTRVLRVHVGLHYETWVGTLGGELYRSSDDRLWHMVDITSRIRGTRTQVLTAVDHGLGHPTVYAAFRSGTLLRFRIGIAGRVAMPAAMVGHPVVAMSASTKAGGFWTWLQGIGAVRLPDFREVPTSLVALGGGDGRVRLYVHQSEDEADVLYAWTEGRVYRQRDAGWDSVLDAGPGSRVHRLVSGFGPRGREGLIAITNTGAFIAYGDGPFERWRDFPGGVRALLVDRTSSPASLLAVRSNRRLERFDGRHWTTLDAGLVPLTGAIVNARMLRFRSGECGLLVGARDGLAMLRTCGGTPSWQLLNDSVVPSLRGNEVTDLATLTADVTAVGTTQGLTILHADSVFAGGMRTGRSITDADGLPHASVTAFGPRDVDGRLWVGTALGLGFVNTSELERPRAPVRISALVMRDVRGAVVADGARLPEANDRIDVEAIVPTYHREEETLFRFELDGAPLHATPWTNRETASLVGLAAGTHVLRVRARDYDGREAMAVERRFTVVRPWWRSPVAGLVYLGVVGAGMFGWVRLRTQSARRRALEAEANERRIAISEARFRKLFEDGTDPQILVLDGSIWQLNAAAEALLARDEGDLRSRSIDEVIGGLSSRLQASADLGRWELDAAGSGGSIPVEVRRTRIPLDGALLDHLELADLRERRRLEAEREELESQLREAQRLESVGTLAGGVAHDFNNLLTVIHTNAELAASDVAASSEAGESLKQLLVASRRAREVVRQILTFSRRTRTHRTEVRIDALMAEMQSLLRSMIPSTVRIVFQDDAFGAVVEGDATQLHQLLLNLCSNAEYAMRATNGGTLSVRSCWDTVPHDQATAVRLTVSDTGVGISAEVRARMFEPFFTTKPVGEGTGLGLSVLHGIVGTHGGTISVSSEEGRGSTFEVVLPARHAMRYHVDTVEMRGASPVSATAQRILLVDDELAVATAVKRLLERRGYLVETAGNGSEALARLWDRGDINLIITDQTMPIMTGTELIEQLRSAGISTPVILASGFGAAVDRAGIDGLADVWRVDKPFATEELMELVSRALGVEKSRTPEFGA